MTSIGEMQYVRARLALAPDTNAHSTGIILPARALVQEAMLDVITAEATGTTKTVSLGIFGGDEDGLLANASVASPGLVRGVLSPARTRGDLLMMGSGGVAQIKHAEAALPIVEDTDAHDTALVIPIGSIILRAWLVVATKEDTGTTKTVNVGIKGGAADGLIKGASVAAAGTIKGTLVSTGQTAGTNLSVDESGTGVLVPEPYICEADVTVNYTLGSADFEEMDAKVVVEYVEPVAPAIPAPYLCAQESTVVVTFGSDDFKELVADAIIGYIELEAAAAS